MSLPAGNGVLVCLILLTFFQGPIFPTLFAVILRGLGRRTKLVSTGLTMAISGGAIWPSVAWVVQENNGGNCRYALVVLVVISAVILAIVLWINLHPAVRHWVDADKKVPTNSNPGDCHIVGISDLRELPVVWEKRPRQSDGSAYAAGLEHIEYSTEGANVPHP
jgi:MFS family permease